MFDESDDKPRRNLMVISLLFIIYALAGGDVTDSGNFGIAYMKITKPEVIEYIAVLLFIYFYWSYWVTHKNGVRNFLNNSMIKASASEAFLGQIIRIYMESVGDDDWKRAAVQALASEFKQRIGIPIPERDGFLEWKVTTDRSIKVEVNNSIQIINIRLSTRINPDYYISLVASDLISVALTTPSFRDILLPYTMAITAIIITIAV